MNTRLIFSGDISFSRYFRNGWKNEGCLSSEIVDYLKSADYVIANVESPLTDRKISSTRELNHASAYDAGEYLKASNIGIWNLANNHIMDCGYEGLNDTLVCAGNNKCLTIGAGNNQKEALIPLILGDEVKIGVISVSKPWDFIKADTDTPGVLTWDQISEIKAVISGLRKKADWVVLVVHGGNEFVNIPLPHVRRKYMELLNLGADLIVGHHPHVVQNYEKIGDKIIFYSLGNFIFDTENQRDYSHTETGVLLGIDFKKDSYSFDCLGIHIRRDQGDVEVSKIPDIFCDIDEDDYRRLWPIEARHFYYIQLSKIQKFRKRLAASPKLFFLLRDIYICRKEEGRIMQKGRFLCLFKIWKKTSRERILSYLLE